jgi:hypothetical protein
VVSPCSLAHLHSSVATRALDFGEAGIGALSRQECARRVTCWRRLATWECNMGAACRGSPIQLEWCTQHRIWKDAAWCRGQRHCYNGWPLPWVDMNSPSTAEWSNLSFVPSQRHASTLSPTHAQTARASHSAMDNKHHPQPHTDRQFPPLRE